MPRLQPLRIVIPGGTGYLGTMLARHFHEQGHSVATITRFPKAQEWPAVHWDAENLGDWAQSLEDADAVINLAGHTLQCRHHRVNRNLILSSRVRTTQLIREAVNLCSLPPRVWLNISCVAGDFAVEVSHRIEAEATAERTRVVNLRTSPVMSPEAGGLFTTLLRLVRWGFGGEMGNGEQIVSWIHDSDFVRAVEFLILQTDVEGVAKIAAPHLAPNHEFMFDFRHAWSSNHFGLPAPAWAVKTAAFLVGTSADPLLCSCRVVPEQLLRLSFPFQFPEWRGACENLISRWRAAELRER